uniref:Uncharacterized protein n=1 Tax=Knipowitschia caucasica TaxID=637954 RepID=A0AAV2MSH4_KNICA
MTVDKIGTIFQVNANTLYITDDANTAIFPESSGNFFLWVVNMVLNQQFLFPSCVEHLLLPPLGCPNLEHLDKVAPTCFLLRISKGQFI